MSGIQPVAVYALKVPAGDVIVPAASDFPAMFRVSMAAIDPSAEPELVDGEEVKRPRATLKMIRLPIDDLESEITTDNEDDEDEEGISSDEEMNGGPSDISKQNKAKDEAEAEEDGDSEEDESNAKAALMRLMKGKGKAGDTDANDDDLMMGLDFEDDDDEGNELEEVVICTLDPENVRFI